MDTVPSRIDFERLPSRARKTVRIRVGPERAVSVFAPVWIDDNRLAEIVYNKRRWILNKQQIISMAQLAQSKREFVSGEGFLYRGRRLRLKLMSSNGGSEAVFTDTTRLFCKANKPDDKQYVRTLLEGWYKSKAVDSIPKRVGLLSKKVGINPSRVVLKNQHSRWGSCTTKGDILLNWRIIMAPTSVSDYVILHELAHLKEKNHSERFWQIVETIMPRYEAQQSWLKKNGGNMIWG